MVRRDHGGTASHSVTVQVERSSPVNGLLEVRRGRDSRGNVEVNLVVSAPGEGDVLQEVGGGRGGDLLLEENIPVLLRVGGWQCGFPDLLAVVPGALVVLVVVVVVPPGSHRGGGGGRVPSRGRGRC